MCSAKNAYQVRAGSKLIMEFFRAATTANTPHRRETNIVPTPMLTKGLTIEIQLACRNPIEHEVFVAATLCRRAIMVFRRRSTAQEPEHKAVKAMATGPTDNNNDSRRRFSDPD